jgi:hypothetical protein
VQGSQLLAVEDQNFFLDKEGAPLRRLLLNFAVRNIVRTSRLQPFRHYRSDTVLHLLTYLLLNHFKSVQMSDNGTATSGAERLAIGITLGNSNSSIAYTVDGQPQVIANEDGGMVALE